jgi:hypothetical protein
MKKQMTSFRISFNPGCAFSICLNALSKRVGNRRRPPDRQASASRYELGLQRIPTTADRGCG